jgi:prepilin-type N-terminal cleavage/methylation domain-containing protein
LEKTLIFENEKMKFKRNAFTLIETIVSITILSIIMVSVLFIFVSSTDMSYKIDINRAMQENIKNIDEQLSEDIRKNGVNICNG